MSLLVCIIGVRNAITLLIANTYRLSSTTAAEKPVLSITSSFVKAASDSSDSLLIF